jgi:hypothetical protein
LDYHDKTYILGQINQQMWDLPRPRVRKGTTDPAKGESLILKIDVNPKPATIAKVTTIIPCNAIQQ